MSKKPVMIDPDTHVFLGQLRDRLGWTNAVVIRTALSLLDLQTKDRRALSPDEQADELLRQLNGS